MPGQAAPLAEMHESIIGIQGVSLTGPLYVPVHMRARAGMDWIEPQELGLGVSLVGVLKWPPDQTGTFGR